MTSTKHRSPIRWITWLVLLAVLGAGGFAANRLKARLERSAREKEMLLQVIGRLKADSRAAEVIVTEKAFNAELNRHLTTIKFLEYDVEGRPLKPRYYTFSGNIIQFQSLVVRFDDALVEAGDYVRGRSAYLFWKVFRLDGNDTEEYVITPVHTVPEGYRIGGERAELERQIWKRFWDYALQRKLAASQGIKNAQIEAPGTKFLPGYLYTLRIEHDGGIRIEAAEIPEILKGERVIR